MEVERRAARVSRLKSSRSFKRRRTPRMPPIREAHFGKSITVKLRYTTSLATPSTGPLALVQGLVTAVRASNDWNDFANGYQFFNINKVKVHVIPSCNAVAFATPGVGMVGMAYSGKDVAAITNINQVADYENYMFWATNFADPNSSQRYFKFRPKPAIQPPQATSDTAQNFGWIKFYSDFVAVGTSIPCANIIYTFDVTFSGQA